MTPPEAPEDGIDQPGETPPAASVCAPVTLTVLRKRSDFLKAARARRQGTSTMMVQARKRGPDEGCDGIRVGFTCSKKVGNAVARNRAKRRLREVARQILPEMGRQGWDYVLIGRAEATGNQPFGTLLNDLRYALRKLHGPAKQSTLRKP